MTQFALDLLVPAAPSLDNFVTGRNAEAIDRLRALAAGDRTQRFVHLWGAPGVGKTHLLQALAAGALLLGPESPLDTFVDDPSITLYAIDDCDRLDESRQQALFRLFNRLRPSPGSALVSAAGAAPLGLALREDLRTRLGWGLVFEITVPSDDDKLEALRTLARERGLKVAADVFPYLLTHAARDLRSQVALLDALDRYGLEQQRPLTLPLLRRFLQRGLL